MLELTELAIAALAVLVAALVLRLRQNEPAAIERLGRRLDEAREELAAAEARIGLLREEIAVEEEVLAPLQVARAELEADVARTRVVLERDQSALEELGRALSSQRAQRAEAEAALRDARQQLEELGQLARRPATGGASGRVVDRPGPVPMDMSALARAGSEDPTEPPIRATSGAVRPTEPLPTGEPAIERPGDAGKEQSL